MTFRQIRTEETKRDDVSGIDEKAPLSFPVLRRFVDLILPHACPACDKVLPSGPGLCPSCWTAVDFLAAPQCDCCGRPFEFDPGDGGLCGACVAEPPPWTRARASFVYNPESRALITAFKYADRTHLAPTYGAWLARAGAAFLDDADVLVPVPLHPARLFLRRYNQAALLAQALAKETLIPVIPDGLKRLRNTRQQVGLSRKHRERNVKGAFRLNPARKADLEGLHVVLIDDVMTSGATIAACAKALRLAKPREVSVLTLARTFD